MSSEYLYTNPDHNEHITAMEIKTRLAAIDDTLHHMRRTLRDIADVQLELVQIVANLTQESYAGTPEDEEGLLH